MGIAPGNDPGVGKRVAGLLAFAIGLVLVGAAPAAADPAGPTDYRSEVLDVDPPSDAVTFRFIGGDSFLELTVEPGHEVFVSGYRGEPYLRFRADGTVWENERSPATVLNEDRYGDEELPPSVDAEAEPAWRRVGDGGRHAWHDHRTHWMNPSRPLGASPGDRILEAVVPIEIDGEPTAVTVASTWVAGPGAASWSAVTVAALAAAVAVGLLRRDLAGMLGPVVAATALLGAVAYRSVPAETGPALTLWALPAIAALAVVGGILAPRSSSPMGRVVADGLAFLAAANLLVWAWLRREALVRAIVPSDTPAIVDRAGIAMAFVAGAAGVGVAVVRLVRPRPAG